MKKKLFLGLALVATVTLTSCKTKQSAWDQAYNKAVENVTADNNTVAVTPVNNDVAVTPVTTPTTPAPAVADEQVRTIEGPLTVISGNSLKTYSVVVGSFVTQANAQNLKDRLANAGYDSRVVKTNETINGQTGWYRVVASSYTDKASAVQSRNDLKNEFAGAWLLYTK